MITGLCVLTIVFVLVQIAALGVLHMLHTGYSPITDAISDYGVGKYHEWFWLQAISGGISCLALGVALLKLHPLTPRSAAMALIVAALARFLIPFFATDQHGSRFQTGHGIVHMLLAFLAFGGIVWAASGLWDTLKLYPAWSGEKTPLTVLPWIMLGSLIAIVLALRLPVLKHKFGVFERLFYVSSMLWVVIVAINVARVT